MSVADKPRKRRATSAAERGSPYPVSARACTSQARSSLSTKTPSQSKITSVRAAPVSLVRLTRDPALIVEPLSRDAGGARAHNAALLAVGHVPRPHRRAPPVYAAPERSSPSAIPT